MTKICGSTTGGLQTFGYLGVYKILPKDRNVEMHRINIEKIYFNIS